MRISYPFVFSDGYDSESGCGWTIAYTRYLLALVNSPHSFYDYSGNRVELTDGEKALIEDGNTKLSRIEECDVIHEHVGNVVADVQSDAFFVGPGSSLTIQWPNGYIDSDYVYFSGSALKVSVAGFYLFSLNVVPENIQSQITSPSLFQAKIDKTGIDRIFAGGYWYAVTAIIGATAVFASVLGTGSDFMKFEVFNPGTNQFDFSNKTRLQVIKLP